MTPEQIKEEIREFLDLNEKAGGRPWHSNLSHLTAKVLLDAIEGHEEVIACFNVAEFEGLQERLSEQQYETGNLRDLIERRIYYAKLESETAIKTICRTWEESK